jgi:hypothetical protein
MPQCAYTGAVRLPNPERAWASPVVAVRRDEVERRIGPVSEPLEVLSGGLCNINVRIGVDRVLRIRGDRSALGKEATLLSRPWRSFRTPAVLATGDDYLLLNFRHTAGSSASVDLRSDAPSPRFTRRRTRQPVSGDDLTLSKCSPAEHPSPRSCAATDPSSPVASHCSAPSCRRASGVLRQRSARRNGEPVDVPVLRTPTSRRAIWAGRRATRCWCRLGVRLGGTRYMDIGHLALASPGAVSCALSRTATSPPAASSSTTGAASRDRRPVRLLGLHRRGGARLDDVLRASSKRSTADVRRA